MYVWSAGVRPSTTGEPSPKSQVQVVGTPVEVSLTDTVTGTIPLVGVAPKDAVGGGGSMT